MISQKLGASSFFYGYDGHGSVRFLTDSSGTITDRYDYDAYDNEDRRLTSSQRGDPAAITTYMYDKLGRLEKTIAPGGATSITRYDDAGQVIETEDALQHITKYTYDDAGRRKTVTDPLNHTTTFDYDKNGNQTSVLDARNKTTQFVYDEAGRRTKVIYHDQSFEQTDYDELGRVKAKRDQAAKITQYTYDKLGRLTSVKDALNQVTSYTYDEVGNRITQTDANSPARTTRYEYDKMGRRSKRTLPLGQFETYTYDNAGKLRTKTDFNGKTTTYAYNDNAGRLLSKTPDPSFGAAAVTFTYFPTGMRQSMTDPSGTTNYTYDNRNRLKTKATPFGTLTYNYDAINLLSITSSNVNGASMTYTYDELNRLKTVANPGSGTTTYSYDEVGNLAGYAYPNGVSTSYTYNDLNRLTEMGSSKAGTALSSYTYGLGAAGNRTSVSELSGRSVTYVYDDLYRLTSETISGAASQNGTIGYSYDAVGNRLSMTSTVPAIPAGLFNYDANDRLTTDSYDNNGNTTVNASIANTYDFENHLIQRGAITVVYDGDGNRVSKTAGGVTTKYLVDTNNLTGYSQLLEEIQSGSVVRSYTYGLDLISQKLGASDLSFYGYDGHGSVRQLTDASGTVTDMYDYDAFGNLVNRTGTTLNNYLYAGEQFDPDLGLYYNRARYLDVRVGRFWGMDEFEGTNFDPLSLHKYLYADADPVNRNDPSGRFTVAQAVTVAVIVIGVASAVGYYYYNKDRQLIVNVGVEFRNDWSLGREMLTTSEIDALKTIAFSTMREAYRGFGVFFHEGPGSTHKVIVRSGLYDSVGQTMPFSTISYVNYDDLYGTMLNVLDVSGPGEKYVTRAQLIEGLGRGIGATGAHEVGHQGRFTFATDTTRCSDCYDTHSARSAVHFFGTKHWSPAALDRMKKELPAAPQ